MVRKLNKLKNEILLDCGHESNKWIKVNGKTKCLSCYKKSKHRRKHLKEVW
ncbi:TPA_asm: hypothetical protein ES702_05905 [Lokiarchaeia virus SkuldV3]|uniref:Uncharacterized protein n=1 Tax=Lokiarchaeia virus SkuldV3 TaxID=2983915 RepID=A0A9N6YJ47_9VIRU|nr:hypothetical protein QKT74_gp02 [Lokiarchaeia virus SkuldV3]DAZ90942.1 TPA_asm: hypothetical protein ES702_05905 [Lokiarchaeia virus SkuldV3]